jgi:hypothetical protein
MRYKLEFNPTNPPLPVAIWDQEKIDKGEWDGALVEICDSYLGMAYYRERVARMNEGLDPDG